MIPDLLVVKLGGAEGVDHVTGCNDLVAFFRRTQRPVILVHGVSAEADRLCAEAGHPARTLTSPSGHSSRYTDRRTRDLFVQAAGIVNAQILDLPAQGRHRCGRPDGRRHGCAGAAQARPARTGGRAGTHRAR